MREKKVVAVIVEGTSDEAALGSVLKEHFSNHEVQFVVIHGDITSEDYTTMDNIISLINKQIDSIKSKYSYKQEDFQQIIHIADTDGVFTKDKVVQADVDRIMYYEDRIETKNVAATLRRNEKKAEILFKLRGTSKVNGINYRIYFNSCNLEHVLYNKLADFTAQEKADMADDFAEKYEGRLDEFISFISNAELAVSGTYNETWKYIEKDCHSLERNSNMHLIFM
ncbi:MAG: hypothetical protein LUI87_06960 [Lachnospiraceae bacterium]|nr:hypothetical protein [Lachnospiraceae bacterium]